MSKFQIIIPPNESKSSILVKEIDPEDISGQPNWKYLYLIFK